MVDGEASAIKIVAVPPKNEFCRPHVPPKDGTSFADDSFGGDDGREIAVSRHPPFFLMSSISIPRYFLECFC